MTTDREGGPDPLGRVDPAVLGRLASAGGVERTDAVVVCGAGPTGLVAALTLARAGVPVLVLEKGEGLSAESRASTFHPPTLELLDELDLAGPVVASGLRAPTTQFRDRRAGPVATFDLGVLADLTPFPFRIQLEQDKFTAAGPGRPGGGPGPADGGALRAPGPRRGGPGRARRAPAGGHCGRVHRVPLPVGGGGRRGALTGPHLARRRDAGRDVPGTIPGGVDR